MGTDDETHKQFFHQIFPISKKLFKDSRRRDRESMLASAFYHEALVPGIRKEIVANVGRCGLVHQGSISLTARRLHRDFRLHISVAQSFVPVELVFFALVNVKHHTPDDIGWFAGIEGVTLSGVVIAYFVKREPVIFQACSGDLVTLSLGSTFFLLAKGTLLP